MSLSLSIIRVSAYRLDTESGRWNNTDITDWKFEVLEDEFHFIFSVSYTPTYGKITSQCIKNAKFVRQT